MSLLILMWLISLDGSLAESTPCGQDSLKHLTTAGFEVFALCDRRESVTEVSITLRHASRDQTGGHLVARELRELELSFSGSLVGTDVPAGWKAESRMRIQPPAVVVRWSPTGSERNTLIEDGRASFKVRLTGDNAGVACGAQISTDILVGGSVCGLPPSPPNTLHPTAAMRDLR